MCWLRALQVWENWTPEDDVVPGAEDEDGEAASSSGAGERLPCMVTEVVSGNDFFLQVVDTKIGATLTPIFVWVAGVGAAVGRWTQADGMQIGRVCPSGHAALVG